jgi:hypothetical protein
MNCTFCKEPLTNGRHPLTDSGSRDVTGCQIVFLLRRNSELTKALIEAIDTIENCCAMDPGNVPRLREAL